MLSSQILGSVYTSDPKVIYFRVRVYILGYPNLYFKIEKNKSDTFSICLEVLINPSVVKWVSNF